MNYIELELSLSSVDIYSDILQSDLCDIGFESFLDKKDGFFAYCQKEIFNQEDLDFLLNAFRENNTSVNVSYNIKEIEQQDWNMEWEKSYEAVLVDDFCYIRASFHSPIKNVEFNIEISPKMSFGTAHHPTTYQIIQLLRDEPLEGKDVMDMGTGTGVLAILCKLKGAKSVDAWDNDEWAYENAKENVMKNNVEVDVQLGDASGLSKSYDLFIANINRNILLQDMATYSKHLRTGGTLLLSGFYDNDVEILEKCANENNLHLVTHISKENWAALRFIKKQ